ncbi:MAG TPA: hypothetical protein VGQ26_10930, partial [Streptosporangiaceae bacterium]|nr:hypothetical protein [Streptosporangiaceae bacterium]
VSDEGAQAAAVQRAIRPQAVALALFALVLGLTALLIVGQAATRLLATSSLDTPALAALGLTRRQLTAAGLIKVGVAAAIGAAVAAGVAAAASPLMPIGAARLAEPDPGVSADALVLAAGAAVIVVLLVAWAVWPAWRLASTGTRENRALAGPGLRSRLTASLAGAGAPLTATTGVRLALEPGRGRTAVPVRADRHRTVGARGDSRVHLWREPAASGQHAPSIWATVGRGDRSAVPVLGHHTGGRRAPAQQRPRHH